MTSFGKAAPWVAMVVSLILPERAIGCSGGPSARPLLFVSSLDPSATIKLEPELGTTKAGNEDTAADH
jgi:hypothetical protein